MNLEYTPEEAQRLVLDAVAPLGTEYAATIQKAFAERWIDLFPNDGKRSGAYSNGIFSVHPYMLINYNGKYDDVSTLAHELGHTMQSYLSDKTQPYATADYRSSSPRSPPPSTSRCSSTTCSSRSRTTTRGCRSSAAISRTSRARCSGRRSLPSSSCACTRWRQKGQPITGDALAKLYLDITRRYYGHDQGVAVVDDYIAHEWSMIPHFYRDFYVFQYATSFTASEALAAKVKSGDAAATKRYLAFLSAGGSKYPIDLLKDAGVDMTTDEPLDLTIRSMNRVMDEMEKILAAKSR